MLSSASECDPSPRMMGGLVSSGDWLPLELTAVLAMAGGTLPGGLVLRCSEGGSGWGDRVLCRCLRVWNVYGRGMEGIIKRRRGG